MPSRTWTTTLDDAPLELRADVDVAARSLVVVVDGFPVHRETLPASIAPQHKAVTTVSGHRVAVVVVPTPSGIVLQAAIDGRDLDTDRGEEALGLPMAGGALVPARLPLDTGLYYACYPRWMRATAGALLAGITMLAWALFDVWQRGLWTEGSQLLAVLAGGAAATGLGWMWRDVRHQRRRFAWGDTRPGVVVALDPVCVAVSADLAIKEREHVPVVRLSRQPLDRIGDVALGDRVVMVVVYEDSQDGTRWHDVDAVAASCGCSDEAALARLATVVPPGAWDTLDQQLDDLGRPTAPGLYPVPFR